MFVDVLSCASECPGFTIFTEPVDNTFYVITDRLEEQIFLSSLRIISSDEEITMVVSGHFESQKFEDILRGFTTDIIVLWHPRKMSILTLLYHHVLMCIP